MYRIRNILDKTLPSFLLIFLFVSLAVHFINNSSSGVLGKDESLYISLAKGQYSHTPIDAPVGNLLDVAKKGVIRSADPPGIFILLHFWEYISYSEMWLRLLPFIFFVISIVTLIRIALLIGLPFLYSVLLGFLPMASRVMVWHAIELRGYMAEACMGYLMIYAALKIIMMLDKGLLVNRGKWAVLSLFMIAGLSFRFSFIMVCAAMYGVLLIGVLLKARSPHFKKNLIRLIASSAVSALFCILFFGTKLYFTINDPLFNSTTGFGEYIIPGGFLSKIIYLVKQMTHIPITLFAGTGVFPGYFYFILILGALQLIGFFIVIYRMAYYLFRAGGIARIKTEDTVLYCGLFLFPAIVVILGMFLAILGLYPFTMEGRWSFFLLPSFHLFIIGMIKMAVYYKDKNSSQKDHAITNKFYRTGLVFIMLPMMLIYGGLYLTCKVTFRTGGDQHTLRVISNMIPEDKLKDVDYWYVSMGEADSFKYHVLYGSLKNKLSPKAKIVIENRLANSAEVKCSELDDIYREAKKGSKVVMVMGHLNEKESSVYIDIFLKYFKDAKVGRHESSSEQVCYAVR